MAYTRRQELVCTEEQMNAKPNVVLRDGEVIRVRKSNGSVSEKMGDGVTRIVDLPYLNEAERAAQEADRAEKAADRAAQEAEDKIIDLVGQQGIVQETGDSPTAVMSQKAVTAYTDRIVRLDGTITPPFESGGMGITDGALYYAGNPKKIRTKEGIVYKVKAGSKAWLTDYTGLTLAVYFSVDGSYYRTRTIASGEHVFEQDCYVAISINATAAQTDTSNAAKLVFVDAGNVSTRVSALEDQHGYAIDEGYGYSTSNGVTAVRKSVGAQISSIKARVQRGEKYKIISKGTSNYRPYVTTDENLNIIRLCESTSTFSGEVVIEDGEVYLICNFDPSYEHAFYQNTQETLSIVKETLSEDAKKFDGLLSKDILPIATKSSTSAGVTYTPQEDGTVLATGTVNDASYYKVFAQDSGGFPDHFYPGKTYYVDYYSYDRAMHFQVSWLSADGTYTYLLDRHFGGYFTIPEDAIGIRFRWYLGSTVAGLVNYPLRARVYSVESAEFARLKKEKTEYKPMLSIIYDDSESEFHEYVLPIIKGKNVPIATAVISKSVNENKSGKMTWEQVEDCYLNGAEILDHTYAHIHPDERANMSVEELEREYLMGRHLLQFKGYNPPCALVFNGYSSSLENCRRAAARVYKAGFNADNKYINFHGQFDPYFINRHGTDGATLETLKGWLDELIAAGTGWMVWMRHNSNASTEDPTAAAAILSSAIDYAISNGIDIVTVERGLYEYLDI